MDEKKTNIRSAGLLMHITSLPGPPLIGDIGPAAHGFADFLSRCQQTVWQMLPIHPITGGQGYSPYSASSAMAGSPLLISPELLVKDGWLEEGELLASSAAPTGLVDYGQAEAYKEQLLDKAYARWMDKAAASDRSAFEAFCKKEDYWLNDYAAYILLKKLHQQAPWYEWPTAYKKREPQALEQCQKKHASEITKVKWAQYLFDKQWRELRSHCQSRQVRLLGDVPIYVAYDSADTWSRPDIFTLDEQGALTEIAGVPPDVFNDDGQLWGMPLFKWDRLKEQGYDWWARRIQRNMDFFDVLRLDHFRGFSAYWSVPAGASSAKNGSWKPGPGKSLFEQIRKVIGALPFVAEDLGEIDEPVYILRDELGLPGMNVLQFAFGDDMPDSPYLPHHHVPNALVYTGTHDNNTTVGWLSELGRAERKNLSAYMGVRATSKNVSDHLCRMAYMSVCNLVILPIQDLLSLDGSARMNMPASSNSNWTWRLKKEQLTSETEKKLNLWCFLFDRRRLSPLL